MKTLVLVFVGFGAFLSMADAQSLKIIVSKLVSGQRYIVYENCGWSPPSVTAHIAASSPFPAIPLFPTIVWTTVTCTPLTSPIGYTNICGWNPPFNALCQYMECTFPDIWGFWAFYVKGPSMTACNFDVDGAVFSFGNPTPIACC